MPRDINTYKKYTAWYEGIQKRARAWELRRQAQRRLPFRRTGPAPQWHPDAYTQPGEIE